jgi:hypothetical protein
METLPELYGEILMSAQGFLKVNYFAQWPGN